ncbi:MAG: glycosyltransferase [Ilumatobacteraceae bacterium]
MRVGVYNLYWNTFGGGEYHAAGFVEALAAEHDVEMVGPGPLDLDEVRERMALELPGVTFRPCDAEEPTATRVSADYDLFLNHAYRSTAVNAAPLGLYSVMFPHELVEGWRQKAVKRVGRSAEGSTRLLGRVGVVEGRTVIERGSTLQVPLDARRVDVTLDALRPTAVDIIAPGPGAPVQRITVDGRTSTSIDLVAGHHGEVVFVPAPFDGSVDRHRGLWLEALRVDGTSVSCTPGSLAQRTTRQRWTRFLDSYDRVIANSPYTLEWTRRRWGRGDLAITPPVQLRSPGTKERLIVTLGRFFDPRSGHSKRQLELVTAFRRLVESGVDDWRLVIIGGCQSKDREYAMAVRQAAAGLPIEVRLSAPKSVVDDHLSRASLYWHAAGYGSDLDAHPERAEHFGIAPVEAMSTGAVPIVFGAAGPKDVVEHGVSGFHFQTLDELVSITRGLIADEARRSEIGRRAIGRAAEFDEAHFRASVRAVVAEISVRSRSGSGQAHG